MSEGDPYPAGGAYDRQLLVLGPKRDVELELWEVQRYGSDSYGDAANLHLRTATDDLA